MWKSIRDWWVIDPEEEDAPSRFFWRVFQIVWFFAWLGFQTRPAQTPTPSLDFVTDSVLSTCFRWTYSGVWANGKHITPRVEGATCGTSLVQPMAPNCKKVRTSHGPIMLCLEEGEAHVGGERRNGLPR